MNLSSVFALYLSGRELPHLTRDDFYSNQGYALYYALKKAYRFRKTRDRIKKYITVYDDKQHIVEHHKSVLALELTIMKAEEEVLTLLRQICTGQGDIIIADVYRNAVEFPEISVPPVNSHIKAESGVLEVTPDNIGAIWDMIERTRPTKGDTDAA